MCATLKWNKHLLESFQQDHDVKEQAELAPTSSQASAPTTAPTFTQISSPMFVGNWGPMASTQNQDDQVQMDVTDETYQADCDSDAEFSGHLDRLYSQRAGGHYSGRSSEDVLEENENGEEDEPLVMPTKYMPHNEAETMPEQTPTQPFNTDVPRADALHNPYVRIVHTNGIHHLSAIFCNCRGHANMHCDLMAAGLVPTSFVCY